MACLSLAWDAASAEATWASIRDSTRVMNRTSAVDGAPGGPNRPLAARSF